MADGWLTPVRPGVLLIGGGEPTPWQRAAAAGLIAGESAALSHSTAARVHHLACALPADQAPDVEISAAAPSHPRLADCLVHRVDSLDDEVVRYRGIRVTAPVRTLIDLAPSLPVQLLAKTVDEGLIRGLWREPDLVIAVGGLRKRAGAVRLREVMARRGGSPPTEIGLEQRAVRALACFAPFATGYEVAVGRQVFILDIAWPEFLVGVECDGWRIRSRSRSKFDHDRRRNNLLIAQGWSIAHLTSSMSDDEMRTAVASLLFRGRRARG